MIVKYRYDELPPLIHQQLNTLIDENFGHIPIVNETKWALPSWSIIKYEEDQVASFFNIIVRDIYLGNNKHKVAGINNVITPTAFRGNGYSTNLLSWAKDFIFRELQSDLGLLLCADEMIPFYENLGWYVVQCPVYCLQPKGLLQWNANTMLLSPQGKFSPKKIDLNGLPW